MYDVCGPESKEGVLTENKIGVLFPKGKTTDICCISEAVGFPGGSGIKNLCASREGNGTPLQYSCLENPMDGGSWWATVHGVARSQTRLSDFTFTFHFHFSLSCIGERNGNPLRCSCLENPRDRGAWWAAVYGVAQSGPRLKRLSSSS